MPEQKILNKEENLEYRLKFINRETTSHIVEKYKEVSKLKIGVLKLVCYPIYCFFKQYFFNGYYRLGIFGFVKSGLDSIEKLLLISKMWEYNFRKRNNQEHMLLLTEQKQAQIESKYFIN